MLSPTEIRTQITHQIVEALTNGNLPPWRRPWANDPNAAGLHTSLSSGNPYRGINQLLLQLAASHHGFQSKWWGTFNQIKASGGYVCRGRKGDKDHSLEADQPQADKRTMVKRSMTTFSSCGSFTSSTPSRRAASSSTESVLPNRRRTPASGTNTPMPWSRPRVPTSAMAATKRSTGRQRTSSKCRTAISSRSPESFYETTFHELCHWTEKRVGFDRSQAENTYALGELVAEIGSCFLMGELGLPTTSNLTNHAAYLESWLTGMNGDAKVHLSGRCPSHQSCRICDEFQSKSCRNHRARRRRRSRSEDTGVLFASIGPQVPVSTCCWPVKGEKLVSEDTV